jgi:hypothetical protein
LQQIIQFFNTFTGGEIAANLTVSFALAALAGILSGAFSEIIRHKRHQKQPSYHDRINKLASTLQSSSSEVDSILNEIAKVTLERQKAAESLKLELDSLGKSEKEMKERIDALKSVPLPVAEHFAKLLETGEKRNAKRDYLLFGLGVITSVISAIVLKALGIA